MCQKSFEHYQLRNNFKLHKKNCLKNNNDFSHVCMHGWMNGWVDGTVYEPLVKEWF